MLAHHQLRFAASWTSLLFCFPTLPQLNVWEVSALTPLLWLVAVRAL